MITSSLCNFPVSKLAMEKGFDEPCMAFWEWYEWKPALEPIAHEKPVMDFRKVDWGLSEAARKRPGMFNGAYQPVQNSKLQPWLYARPTQDLLAEWLRVEHNIHVYAKLARGSKAQGIPPLWMGGLYTSLFDDGDQINNAGASASKEEAMNIALLLALKRLPNETRNTKKMPAKGVPEPRSGDHADSGADEKRV